MIGIITWTAFMAGIVLLATHSMIERAKYKAARDEAERQIREIREDGSDG